MTLACLELEHCISRNINLKLTALLKTVQFPINGAELTIKWISLIKKLQKSGLIFSMPFDQNFNCFKPVAEFTQNH